ncbi:putative transcriptional regulator [Peptoniphilus sp. ING2-D1G]|nr:putative transcriptional regulator [Peptoniphilus sp. ING2-D1G]
MKYVYRIFIVLSITLLSGLVIFAYRIKPEYANKGINKLDKSRNEINAELDENLINVFKGSAPLRILLLGVDKSKTKDYNSSEQNMRTDTIMLFSIFPKEEKVQILSIPRDSYVNIHGYGKHKINSAFNPLVYPDGGLNLTVKTVEDFLDVDINHYAIVDYEAVIRIVDTVGGIDINWEHDDYTYVDDWVIPPLEISLKRGINHLDGQEAVNYLRVRKAYANQDIGRIENQQGFLLLLFDKLKSPATFFKIPELLDIVDQYVETDFNYGEIAYLAKFGLGIEREDIFTETLQGKDLKGVNLGGIEVTVYDVNRNYARDLVHDFPDKVSVKGVEDKKTNEEKER